MNLQTLLQSFQKGRILDIATGKGGFVEELLAALTDYDEIVAIDNNPSHGDAFTKAFADNPRIHFQLMDAAQLDFEPNSFDLVCVSNSLHHFADPSAVLVEMKRVCKPGGRLIVAEMIRDGQTETQMTHVLLHHWWGEVDQLKGIIHRATYTRAELGSLIAPLALTDFKIEDLDQSAEDPHDPELLAELDGIVDMYIQRADGQPELQSLGEELRKRIHAIGFQNASRIILTGCK